MMDLNNKIKSWVQAGYLTDKQKNKILEFEHQRQKDFKILGLMWLGVFVFVLGLVSLVMEYWQVIPNTVKISCLLFFILIGICTTIYGFRKEQTLLLESALFFTFLIIGGGIGLLAQIFHLPVNNGEGLLAWAGVSLIIVLLSEKELLSLLWIPLFIGGVLGYLRLEFLLLFLAQAPLITVSILLTALFLIIYLTGLSQTPFLRAMNRWGITLYYFVLFLGESGIESVWESFGICVFFLALLTFYAVKKHRMWVFNITLFLLAVRSLLFILETLKEIGVNGIWFIGIGLITLLTVGGLKLFYKSQGK